MMISPELFQKMHADETYEELLLVRDELLDSIIEYEDNPEHESIMFPSPDVVYHMNLLYLGKLCELIAEKLNLEAKKDSPYGEDEKGRYRIIGGKKCYTKEEIEKELEKVIRKIRFR